jgi:hypothetical protein
MNQNQAAYIKNTYCSYCGRPFPSEQSWPRHCIHCRSTTFLNPTPVAAELIILSETAEMAFPLHQQAVADYFTNTTTINNSTVQQLIINPPKKIASPDRHWTGEACREDVIVSDYETAHARTTKLLVNDPPVDGRWQ